MSAAIKVEDLSKAYQLGQIGTGTISRDLQRWYARMRGKEDPFLKIGESNNQNTKSESDIVWSLKDINFEIEQGDTVGIIGRNGAGKSTLLKILSKVTAPTTGRISGKGRIASLLEVGTGFHPELSGRENIFLNGAILGMRKKEIQRKFDEIVDFAGIERYIDTPVKRYSSGMYVRLAFAVAAYLESEILIVDEVLAVGDAEFQKKCLGKMGEVSKGEGRTVLFVSHNMGSIAKLCSKSILLTNGYMKCIGVTSNVITSYLNDTKASTSFSQVVDPNKIIQLKSANLKNNNNSVDVTICIHSSYKYKTSVDFRISDHINNPIAFNTIGGFNKNDLLELNTGDNNITFNLNTNDLALGTYNLSIDLTNPDIEYYDRIDCCIQFEIVRENNDLNSRDLSQNWDYGSYKIPVHVQKNIK